MPSLLLVVFALQLVIHLVNNTGASAINELLWNLYNRLPAFSSNAGRESNRLKGELLRQKREMNAVSAQDDFAKWAKLRRAHDKTAAELEKNTASLAATKAKFDTAAASARWLATNGLRLFLQFWFSRKPMFWLPKNLAPGYIEWFLALPRAPTGSVSIQLWGIACAAAIHLVSEAVVAAISLTRKNTVPGVSQPQAFAAVNNIQNVPGTNQKEL